MAERTGRSHRPRPPVWKSSGLRINHVGEPRREEACLASSPGPCPSADTAVRPPGVLKEQLTTFGAYKAEAACLWSLETAEAVRAGGRSWHFLPFLVGTGGLGRGLRG